MPGSVAQSIADTCTHCLRSLTGNRRRDLALIHEDVRSANWANTIVGAAPDTLTPEQRERVVRYYATMSLVELRRRQGLVDDQKRLVYQQAERKGPRYMASDNTREARAMRELDATHDMLSEAVCRTENEPEEAPEFCAGYGRSASAPPAVSLVHVRGARLPNYENRAFGVGPVLRGR